MSLLALLTVITVAVGLEALAVRYWVGHVRRPAPIPVRVDGRIRGRRVGRRDIDELWRILQDAGGDDPRGPFRR